MEALRRHDSVLQAITAIGVRTGIGLDTESAKDGERGMTALTGTLFYVACYILAGWIGFQLGEDKGRRMEASKRVRRW